MKCSNCGREVSGKFCKYCGSALAAMQEHAAVQNHAATQEQSAVQNHTIEQEHTPAKEANTSASGFGLTHTPLLIGLALLLLVSLCFITPLGGRLVSYVKNIPVGIRNGCSVGEVLDKQEAILKYTNEDTSELKTLSAELSTVLVALSDNRTTVEGQVQDELMQSAEALAKGQSEAAGIVAKNISDDEVKAVHQLYMDYCNTMVETIALFVTACDNGDMAAMDEANARAKTANELVNEYNDALMKLAEKYNLTVDGEL